MRILFIILLSIFLGKAFSQQGIAFTRITTDDGMGLASNVVTSLYQDEKGFIWAGTTNGLQRFDGNKFIQFISKKPGTDKLPHASISQIVGIDSGALLIAFAPTREFGIFTPANFTYKKISLKPLRELPSRAEFNVWKDAAGEVYLNVLRYGILHYNKAQQAFIEDNVFPIPKGWAISLMGIYEDTLKRQVWICTDSGLCIYDKSSKQMFTRNHNPLNLPILKNERVQDHISEIYIDRQRRIWIFGWPVWGGGSQQKFCFDSTGSHYLQKDTVGLNTGPVGYNEYNRFFETKNGTLWVYGLGVLFNYDNNTQRFFYNTSGNHADNFSINYQHIFRIIEDKDGGIWIATDQGLYFTSLSNGNYSVINFMFDNKKGATSITDILEMPNGDFWFTSWGSGVRTMDKNFKKTENYLYRTPPPANWSQPTRNGTFLTWCMCRESATGNVWVGCNGGILLVYNPIKKTTEYLVPPEFEGGSIRYLTEDTRGQIWIGTQYGRLIKWSNNKFTVVQDIGTIIYKVFVDRQGWVWLATHEKGLYAIDPGTGKIIQHYTSGNPANSLYSNTGNDIEQLNDSIIVFGAGALNFINKNTGTVRLLTYDEGLPSNSVARVRLDKTGFLWIITSNGLCRYNPGNNRITAYGRKDGIMLADQTVAADFQCNDGYIMFAGSNGLIKFHPSSFSNNEAPPDVTITDFKLFNQFLPLDSLLQHPEIKLPTHQNSFSIYFASLSYMLRDKLTYYYKLEGIEKDWIQADKAWYVNYSLLPPGRYTFKIYSENIEGRRSGKITEMHIYIKSPFWKTWWFASTLVFFLALVIYAIHNMRINRLLAVEQLRNRVARDLHDDMGSTLSTINILSSMAKSKMSSDVLKTTEYLGKITDNSQRMMEAMDDIVWSIKPSNDTMQKIVARMREFSTNVLEAKEMELNFAVDETVYDIKLNMEARRDFFLVFKEAVNNVAKYSKAGKVWIEISIQNKRLVLMVKDNGIGFDVATADNGNGLGNMQKRASSMHGKVQIQSRKGKGTQVLISLPVL